MTTPSKSNYQFPSLTSAQLAELLELSEATIYRLLKAGEAPPSYKVGKRRLWREADVIDWMEQSCRTTTIAKQKKKKSTSKKRATARAGR